MHQITDLHTEPQSSHSPHLTTNIYCCWMPVQKSLAWTMEPIRISKILWWLEFPPVAIRFAGYNCMGRFTTLTCSGILFISLPLSESDNQTSCLSVYCMIWKSFIKDLDLFLRLSLPRWTIFQEPYLMTYWVYQVQIQQPMRAQYSDHQWPTREQGTRFGGDLQRSGFFVQILQLDLRTQKVCTAEQ